MTAEEMYPFGEDQFFSKGGDFIYVALAIDGYPFDGYFGIILFHVYSALCVDILNSRFCAPAGNTTKYGIGASIRHGIADENKFGDLRFLSRPTADDTYTESQHHC
jgi:hypothetical protein